MNGPSTLVAFSLALLVALGGCSGPGGHLPGSYAEASRLASERRVPLLIDFYSPT